MGMIFPTGAVVNSSVGLVDAETEEALDADEHLDDAFVFALALALVA
jgi:hypothetical protein